MDTDYETYASAFSCLGIAGTGHRQNSLILSRRPFLDNAIADKLRKSFEFFGADKDSLRYVVHEDEPALPALAEHQLRHNDAE